MSVSAFQGLPLADRDREWDGDATEKRVRRWADRAGGTERAVRKAHISYDKDNEDNFGAYKLFSPTLSTGSSG